MIVSLSSVAESLIFGFDATGFMHLAKKLYGDSYFEGKTWSSIEPDIQNQLHTIQGSLHLKFSASELFARS
jgi:hypothetical protein